VRRAAARGDRGYGLSIGGVSIQVTSAEGGPAIRPGPIARRFSATTDDPDLEFSVRWGDLAAPPDGRPVFETVFPWKLYRLGEGSEFRFFSATLGNTAYAALRTSRDYTAGEVVLHRPFFPGCGPLDPIQFPIDEVLFVHYLSGGRGVVLHACAVVDADGTGFLFCGESGDGKTTMARLWERLPGARILTDDRVILRTDADRVLMYGTPWHGEAEFAENVGKPVDRIFFLEHGHDNAFISLSPFDALTRLLVRCFPVYHEVGTMNATLALLERIARDLPCGRLRFVPDAGAPLFVREVLATR